MAMSSQGLRRLVKTGVAVGAHWSGMDRFVASRRGLRRAPLLVGYHRVVEDFEDSARRTMPSMLISTRTLERQLDWIGKRYRFVAPDELAAASSVDRSEAVKVTGGKPMAVVTFDDGYRDVYENAFPLLQRKGIPFAVYVVTDLVGTNRLQCHDELYLRLAAVLALEPAARAECRVALLDSFDGEGAHLESLLDKVDASGDPFRATRLMLHGLGAPELRQCMAVLATRVPLEEHQRREFLSMDWDMLGEMAQSGVTVGSHTRSHTLLATAPEPVVREELEGSRRALEQRLGAPVRHLAYPDGSFNAGTIRAVHAAGYLTACTTCAHGSEEFPQLALPRRLLWERACMDSFGQFSPAILSCEVNGVFDGRERCTYAH